MANNEMEQPESAEAVELVYVPEGTFMIYQVFGKSQEDVERKVTEAECWLEVDLVAPESLGHPAMPFRDLAMTDKEIIEETVIYLAGKVYPAKTFPKKPSTS